MRLVIQRVENASVDVDGKTVGSIGKGMLVLFGVHQEDVPSQTLWLASKLVNLRIFADAQDKMNLSLLDVQGEVLIVSQFTLYGDAVKGRRPSFIDAARPETAIPLYEAFVAALRSRGFDVATGEFGAMMQVELVNEGPVTLILERTA